MSSIKLTADSGGGTFEIKAPSSSGNTRVLTVPDTASGTVLTTTNPKSGNIIQVVATNVAATSSFAFTTDAAGVATPATVTITSSQANSKFLISGSLSGETTRDDYEIGIFLVRSIGGTATAINVGTASGSSKAISQIKNQGYHGSNNASTTSSNTFASYLDSPSQSAGTAITYAIYVMGMNESGTFYVNRTKDNSDHAGHERPSSHITVQEVAV